LPPACKLPFEGLGVNLLKLSVRAHKLSDNEQVKIVKTFKYLIISYLIVFLGFGTSLVIRETEQYNRTHGQKNREEKI